MPKTTKRKENSDKTPKDAGVRKPSRQILYEKRPRNFGIGQDIQPRRDLTRFVRWPRYIRLQRQKRVLLKRLKVPPVINQFSKTLDKNAANVLFTFLEKYRPETKKEKASRLTALAAAIKAGTPQETKKPKVVKFGLNHVTGLIEQNQAKLVVIAHDVDPIELVMWLPTLCRKKGIPYMIVKGKARLGKIVGQKTAAALALVDVDAKDKKDFGDLQQRAETEFNSRYANTMKTVGGGILGGKHNSRVAKFNRALARESSGKK